MRRRASDRVGVRRDGFCQLQRGFELVQRARERQGFVAELCKQIGRQTEPFILTAPCCDLCRATDERQGGEEEGRTLAQPFHRAADDAALVLAASRVEQAQHVPGQILQSIRAHGHAEVLGGHVLELMRFVDDGLTARGNDFAVRAFPDSRIGTEQMVIHDHEIGFGRLLPNPGDEAVLVARARGSETVFGAGGDVGPPRQLLRQVLDLGTVARFRDRGPAFDQREDDVALGIEPSGSVSGGGLAQSLEAMQAEIVAAALHIRCREVHAERFAEDWQILEEDLFLEVLGTCRDERALAAQDGRGEVGQGLAGARARLGKQHAALRKGRRDGGSHSLLRRPGLERRNRLCQGTAVRKDLADRFA